MPIKTSSAKAKGRNLQQWVVAHILQVFPKLSPNDCKSTGMGQSGMDVQLSEAARAKFPYAVECKSNKANSIYKLYDQAVSNKEELEPLLIVKANRRAPLAVVDAEYFFNTLIGGKK